jgi:AbiJ N-terminal domain 4
MLTDIFARRYENVPMWQTFDQPSQKLIVQTFQLLQQIAPYYAADGKETPGGKAVWTDLHTRMTRELGVQELSPIAWNRQDGKFYSSGNHPMIKVCETWMLKPLDGSIPDRFIKERLSLVELGFRTREQAVAYFNAKLPEQIAEKLRFEASRSSRIRVPAKQISEQVKAANASMNAAFKMAVDELNTRFGHASLNLHYHNGFIQVGSDSMVAQEVEAPFWRLVADPKWTNVDHDFKEAIDLRDTHRGDPALYAAKALESTIKIISDEKQLSNGKERGASNYIENLKGGKLIENWEAEALKAFFTKVRNPLSHGPGAGEMPSLNDHQTNWAIENCMIWVKSLVRRIS